MGQEKTFEIRENGGAWRSVVEWAGQEVIAADDLW
jgi:hypothetical protein